jgi:C1A family cysteine protease
VKKQDKYEYGWIKDTRDDRDYLYNVPYRFLKALPEIEKVNLLEQFEWPECYDQGKLGSCTTQAIAAHIQFNQIKQNIPTFLPSRLFIYFNERLLMGTIGYDSGAMLRDGMRVITEQGVCPEDEWKYDIAKFTEKPPQPCYDHALNHQVLMYQRVNQTLEQMQGCLVQGYPFVCGVMIYTSFESEEVTKTGIVSMPKMGWFFGEAKLGGHAILIVGFDSINKTFTFRNSWGTSWGNKGYGTIPYEYLLDPKLAADFWTIRTLEE